MFAVFFDRLVFTQHDPKPARGCNNAVRFDRIRSDVDSVDVLRELLSRQAEAVEPPRVAACVVFGIL